MRLKRLLITAAAILALPLLGAAYLLTPAPTRDASALEADLFAPGNDSAFNPAWSHMCFGNPGMFDAPSHLPLGHLRTVMRDQSPAQMASRLMSPRFIVPANKVFAVLYGKGETRTYVFDEAHLVSFGEDDCGPIRDFCIERKPPNPDAAYIARCSSLTAPAEAPRSAGG